MHSRHRTGFTLIELLVVIAIIAILAAILFPVFARAKASAQRASCSSNLKQLAIAAQNYADEWNGNYPPARLGCWPWGDWNDSTDPKAGYGLRLLLPYAKNKKVFFCPSNLFFNQRYSLYWNAKSNSWWCATSYWGNWLPPSLSPPISNILTPKQIAQNTGHDPYALLLSDIVCTYADGTAHPFNNHPSGQLPEGGNYVCNDGHAKWKWRNQMKELASWSNVKFYW